MRIFLKEMMLDFPCIIVTKSVGQFDLRQRVLVELPLVVHAPWARQLQFIKDAEFHGRFPVLLRYPGKDCASGSRPCQERSGPAASPAWARGSTPGRSRTVAGVSLPYKAAPNIHRIPPAAKAARRRGSA